jgi:hypothetical protein
LILRLSFAPRKIDPTLAETTWVHKIFGGRLRSRVQCSECGYNSDTFDSILDLSLDIHNMTGVRAALRKFVQPDTLKGADKYKCEKSVAALFQLEYFSCLYQMQETRRRRKEVFGTRGTDGLDRASEAFHSHGSQDWQPR